MADTSVFLETVDANDQPITFYTTTGKGATKEQFLKALETYESTKGKSAGKGFVAAPPGFASTIRRGLAETGQTIERGVPQISEAIGGLAGTSPLMMLASKAGLISPQTANAPIAAGRATGSAIGEAVAPYVAGAVNTPRAAGMTTGIAASAPFMAPAYGASAAGSVAFRMLPALGNMAKSALMATAGAEAGALSTGESFDWGKTVEELAIGALNGGLSSVISYGLAKFMPSQAEKVASNIAKRMYETFPNLKNDPELMAKIGPRQIEYIAQQMSTGLQGELDDVTTGLVTQIKNILPHNLSVGQQATLRAHTREVARAYTKLLDAADDKAKDAANKAITNAKQGLVDFFQGDPTKGIKPAYPGIKNIEPTTVRVNDVINQYDAGLETVRQGMQVIQAMRQAGAAEQWNPMTFAQLIRGTYQEPGNPLMTSIGKILGGGRELTEMALPGQREAGSEGVRATANLIKEFIPVFRNAPDLKYRGATVPWKPEPSPLQQLSQYGQGLTRKGNIPIQTGKQAIQGMPDLAVQESGAAAMRRFQQREK